MPEKDQVETPEESVAAPDGSAAAESAVDPEEVIRQRDDYYDRLLRKTAEFDNYKKRIDRERRELAEAAAADLLEELLPLVDNLERALKAEVSAPDAVTAYRQGVELIQRQLMDLLRKRGVRPIETAGAQFDPHFHQAVAHEVSPDHREGEIISELSRGYMLGDRLLRPAMVRVAKA